MPSSLSILIPIYNELATLERVIERIEAVAPPHGLERQLVLVDDASTDGTRELMHRLTAGRSDRIASHHDFNRGKGAAIHTARELADGDLALVQDADLEYDPADHDRLLAPLVEDRADAVLGSRFLGETHRVLYYWHYVGNKLLTTCSNMATNLNLTDMECGYKAFRRDVLKSLTLREPRFGFEPEVIAQLARLDARVFEVSVRYFGRTYAQGKKVNWRDGLSALRCILYYNFLDSRPQDPR